MLLANKAAIITGGAVGIGRGIALKFAEEGCSVAVADISEEEGMKTTKEISQKGRAGIFLQCDVTDSRQVQEVPSSPVLRARSVSWAPRPPRLPIRCERFQ